MSISVDIVKRIVLLCTFDVSWAHNQETIWGKDCNATKIKQQYKQHFVSQGYVTINKRRTMTMSYQFDCNKRKEKDKLKVKYKSKRLYSLS